MVAVCAADCEIASALIFFMVNGLERTAIRALYSAALIAIKGSSRIRISSSYTEPTLSNIAFGLADVTPAAITGPLAVLAVLAVPAVAALDEEEDEPDFSINNAPGVELSFFKSDVSFSGLNSFPSKYSSC